MIRPGEIQKRARAAAVRDQQIEKDYILSWILLGISVHESLSKAIVFKGGTALKKIYFRHYRFSEDLDFTLVDDDISNDQVLIWFVETFEFIREEANINLALINFTEQGKGSINFYISYVGPLGGHGINKKVKVDISRDEVMTFGVESQGVILEYSDHFSHQIHCYSLEEILVEKLRSVIQRMQARDFYDIWYLLVEHEMEIDRYIPAFRIKCACRQIEPSSFPQKLEQRIPQYKGRWFSSLADQINDLPDFEAVVRAVLRQCKKVDWS